MEDFFNDVAEYVEGWYATIVALTPKLLLAVAVVLISLLKLNIVVKIA